MAATQVQELIEMNMGREKVETEESKRQLSPSLEEAEGIPGVVNDGFEADVIMQEKDTMQNVLLGDGSQKTDLPPLTYVDFMPRCVHMEKVIDGKEPDFAQFRTVMEQANQWLLAMPQYKVFKVETIDRKLLNEMKLDLDTTIHHESSNGQIIYVRGMRLWIIPQSDPDACVQQIAYISVLPDKSTGSNMDGFASLALSANFRLKADYPIPSYDSLKTTVEKLNRHLQHRPLPGKILNIETFPLKVMETLKTETPDTEKSCWSDTGKLSRLFLYAIRIYYITGQQKFETIGFHDEIPDIVQTPEGIGIKIKYAPFTQVVGKMAKWIQEQKNIRIVNLQSLNIKAEKQSGGHISLNSNISGYGELPFTDSQFVKILRTFHVTEQKSNTPDMYAAMNLSSRLFVPIKRASRDFEKFSKTMQRAIAWLQVTKSPIFGMETVQYIVHPASVGTGVNDDRVDLHINKQTGRYHLTCIRLYFSEKFEEPSVDLLPPVAEDEAGWGCVIS